MSLRFTAQAMRDFGYWEATDAHLVKKVNALLSSIETSPFTGLGKPEALRKH